MNIYIMADAEGIGGIFQREQVYRELQSARYREGQELMTREVNACVEACKEAGAQRVYVRDCHAGGDNLLWDRLSPLADGCVMGYTGQTRFPGLDECDAVILLGYHAMAGTPGAVLEHTMSADTVQNYWLNGRAAGEVAIDASIAGEQGKPVILVTGDDKVCAEAAEWLPRAVTAQVKTGITVKGGMLLPAERAYGLIREKTREAVERFPAMRPLIPERPVRLRIERVEHMPLPHGYAKPYMRVIDGRTYEVEADTVEAALFRL